MRFWDNTIKIKQANLSKWTCSLEICLAMDGGCQLETYSCDPRITDEFSHLAASMPAKALFILARGCGKINTFIVTGNLPFDHPIVRPAFDVQPIMKSLFDAKVAPTLQDFTVKFFKATAESWPGPSPHIMDTQYGKVYLLNTCMVNSRWDATHEETDTRSQAFDYLHRLKNLTSLNFSSIYVESEGWRMLPQSAIQLEVYRADDLPSGNFGLCLKGSFSTRAIVAVLWSWSFWFPTGSLSC